MATVDIGLDFKPPLEAMLKCLHKVEPRDTVRQLKILELLVATFCLEMKDENRANEVADGLNKHVKQIIHQQIAEQCPLCHDWLMPPEQESPNAHR